MNRIVRSLWITRKSNDDGCGPPELVAAWDEWSVDENYEGWQKACKDALDSLGSDLAGHRYIDIRVREDSLDAIFEIQEIEGRVDGTRDDRP